MKKGFLVLLVILLALPSASLAYAPQEFTQTQIIGQYTISTPLGWDSTVGTKAPIRYDFYDQSPKKAEQGVISIFLHEYDERSYDSLEEANEALIGLMKRNKTEDYELRTVAECPAVIYTAKGSMASVNNTFYHGIFVFGQHSALDVMFSIRGEDAEMQAADFEKLIATITSKDTPTDPPPTDPPPTDAPAAAAPSPTPAPTPAPTAAPGKAPAATPVRQTAPPIGATHGLPPGAIGVVGQ